MRATWKKSLADVTRRKGRTLLVVLGIFVGVFGLAGITSTEDTLSSAITFTASTPRVDVVVTVNRLDLALLPGFAADNERHGGPVSNQHAHPVACPSGTWRPAAID